MIYEIKINPLSKPQIRNLGKGKGVRVYAGNFPIEVDKKQYTRFHNNMRLGKAFTLKLSAKQGKGIFGDIFNFIKSKPLLKSAANAAIRGSKKYAHKGVDYLSRKAHQKIEDFPVIGDGLRRRPLKRRGKGLLGGVFSGAAGLADLIGGPGSSEANKVLNTIGGISNALGLGMRKRRPRKGKGFFGDMAKNIAKKAAEGLVDTAAGYAKNKISGMGMRKRKATPAQLMALAKGRAIRDANRSRTGAGRPRKQYYHGMALRPAGY